MKKADLKNYFALLAIVLLAIGTIPSSAETIIACAGTSVTMTSQYPAVLQRLLGSGYKVYDEGYGGADAGYGWNHFVETAGFAHIVSLKPQFIALEFGANDAHAPADWIDANFYAMYSKFVDTFYTISPKPKVIVCLPPPNFMTPTTPVGNAAFIVSLEHIVVQLKKLVADRNLPYADMNTPLLNHPEYTTDGCHMPPQGAGADSMANALYRVIRGATPTSPLDRAAANPAESMIRNSGSGLSIKVPGNISWTLTLEALDGTVNGRYSGSGNCSDVSIGKRMGTGVMVARLTTASGSSVHKMIRVIP